MAVERTVLEAKPREGSGKGSARRLRAQGLIPAVVYGKALDKPAQIAVDPINVRKAIATRLKLNTLITLKVAGQSDRQVLLKDYQQEPVSRDLLHVDFVDVRESEPIKVKVPVVLIGKAVGVAEGGILSQVRRDLEVYALPAKIPESIQVDVSNLKIAQALHVNEVKLPEGITVKSHVNYTIAVVNVPEKEEVVAPVAAAVPGAPAAAGAAAPAAGDAKGAAAPAADGKGAAPAAGAKKDEKKK